MAEYQEKTEQATPRRRQKAREKGQVPRSRELISLMTVGGIILMFYISGDSFIKALLELIKGLFTLSYGTNPLDVLQKSTLKMLAILTPILSVSCFFAIIAALIQGGVVIKPISIEFEKINPLNGFKRIFSKESLVELFKTLLKFTVGALLCFFILSSIVLFAPKIINFDIQGIANLVSHLIAKAVLITFLTFLVIALIDYALERWRFERSIRMSREEVKEELKETEGDPLIRSRIKSIQRELARRRMMQEVPKSTVVITNPIHIAVALRYKRNEMHAPKVVAKGSGYIAEKIREVAQKHGIPIVEDVPLARALFKLKIDSYIPEELYKAVAKILAYIFKMKGGVV
ncbi:MAG: flagellar biosynthesis protein FlhB [Thermodesulfovibrionales bacterium]|nr:flagellar biosynthesis protein FlhB [Thermodesulfovibrionales bacterium]